MSPASRAAAGEGEAQQWPRAAGRGGGGPGRGRGGGGGRARLNLDADLNRHCPSSGGTGAPATPSICPNKGCAARPRGPLRSPGQGSGASAALLLPESTLPALGSALSSLRSEPHTWFSRGPPGRPLHLRELFRPRLRVARRPPAPTPLPPQFGEPLRSAHLPSTCVSGREEEKNKESRQSFPVAVGKLSSNLV